MRCTLQTDCWTVGPKIVKNIQKTWSITVTPFYYLYRLRVAFMNFFLVENTLFRNNKNIHYIWIHWNTNTSRMGSKSLVRRRCRPKRIHFLSLHFPLSITFTRKIYNCVAFGPFMLISSWFSFWVVQKLENSELYRSKQK